MQISPPLRLKTFRLRPQGLAERHPPPVSWARPSAAGAALVWAILVWGIVTLLAVRHGLQTGAPADTGGAAAALALLAAGIRLAASRVALLWRNFSA